MNDQKTTTYAVELFADQSLLCGEGPVWDADSGQLYWTDCGGEAIYGKGKHDGAARLILAGHHAASLVMHQSGGLVFGGRDGFFHWKAGTAPRLICNRCGATEVININDITADPHGRVFGGQEAFREGEPYETGFLFRIDTDGSCAVVEEGLHLANGMGFSPDCKSFYLIDSIQRAVYVYDYDVHTGSIKNRRTLIQLMKNDGLPDGMTVDREGYLWVARWFGGAISRYDPDGALERVIKLPAAQTSSLTFGGPEYRDLFITSAAQYWESDLAPDQHDFSTFRGGGVYSVSQEIQGEPAFKAGIVLAN